MLQELPAERIIRFDWLCSIIGEPMWNENWEMEKIIRGASQFLLHSFLKIIKINAINVEYGGGGKCTHLK
jgi:hypothetical protein